MKDRNRSLISILGFSFLLIVLASGFFLRRVSGANDNDQITQTTPATKNLLGAKLEQTYALADFNGDGVTDVAVVDFLSDIVSVMAGDRTGNFHPVTRLSSGGGPQAIVAADFNRDGTVDLAVANFFSGGVVILLGQSDGRFQQPRELKLDTGLTTMIGADFDADGSVDLAAANFLSGEIVILKGVGDGSFAAPSPIGHVRAVTLLLSRDADRYGQPGVLAIGAGGKEARLFANQGRGALRYAGTVDLATALSSGHEQKSMPQATSSDRSRVLKMLHGDGQPAPAGFELSQPLVVEAGELSGQPVAGEPVMFSKLAGEARWDDGTARLTDERGQVSLAPSLDSLPGNHLIAAALPGSPVNVFGLLSTLSAEVYTGRIKAALARSSLAESEQQELLTVIEDKLKADDVVEAVEGLTISLNSLTDRLPQQPGGETTATNPIELLKRLTNQVLLLGSATSVEVALTISCGQTVGGNISQAGQQDTHTFSGNAGEVVTISIAPTSGDLCPRAFLHTPSGMLLGSTTVCGSSTDPLTLPVTGTYTILVRDVSGSRTGAYDLNLQFVSGRCATAIACGETKSRNFTSPAQQDAYSFSGTVNEVVTISVAPTSGNLCPRAYLYRSSGALIGATTVCGSSTDSLRLPATGTYTIIVRDVSTSRTGAYDLNLQFVSGRCAKSISCGETKSGNIASPAQQDAFSFCATAGSSVQISIAATSGNLCPRAYLYNLSGALLGTTTVCGSSTNSIPLTAAGNYTIVVRDVSTSRTGGYNLSLSCIGNSCPQSFSASGRVTSGSGAGISGVTMTFTRISGIGDVPAPAQTDASGNWTQTGFQPGTTYRVTPVKPGCTFNPTSRDFSSANTGLNFTGACAQCIAVSISNMLSGSVGGSLTVPITVSDLTGRGVVSYDFTFTFDPNVLRLQNPPVDRTGTISGAMTINTNTGTPGRLTVSAFGTAPLSGAGTLLNLKFDLIGANSACSNLTWTSFRFNEGNPCATPTNGRVCVTSGGAISGTVGYCISPKPVPGVTVTAAGSPSATSITDSSGNYRLTGLSGGPYTVTPAKTGNVNGISSFDASLVAQHVAGLIVLIECQQLAGDASNNGSLSSFDASLIAQTAAGIPNSGIAGTWKFRPPSRAHPNVGGNPTNQNFDAVLVGDVSGNWSSSATGATGLLPTAEAQAGLDSEAAQVAISLPTTSGTSGSSATIPITVGDLTGRGFVAYDFDLVFDQNVLQLQNPPIDAAGTLSGGMNITPNPAPGRLRVSAFGTGALTGSGTLLNLKFNVVGAPGASTALTWQRFFFNEDAQTNLVSGRFNVNPVTTNPVPAITSLSPNSANTGGPGFTLTVNGREFVNGAVVRWNGSNRTTSFVSGAQLTVAITAADIATVGAAGVTVFNPAPGGGASNALSFTITSAATVAMVSAASFSGTELASESMVAAFGSGLATATRVATVIPLPTSLAGTQVEVRDSVGVARLAPLFLVSPAQINFLMPRGAAVGTAIVTVTSGDGRVSTGSTQIATVAPGLFSANASGQGIAAAIAMRIGINGTPSFEPVARFDVALNRFISVPIDPGPETDQVFLILFGTGIRLRSSLSAVTARIGGVDAPVLYVDALGGFAGLDQVNLRLPRNLTGSGEMDIILSVDGKTANTVKVNIRGQQAQPGGPEGGRVSALFSNGSSLFVGTDSGGIFRSTNDGQNWTPVNSGLTSRDIRAFTTIGTNLFAGTGAGVFLSTNDGQSWTAVNSGLANSNARNVSALAVSGANLFAGASGGVSRSADNGHSWTLVNAGLTNTNVFELAVSGDNLFAGTLGGGVFLSTDQGQSWTPVSSGLTNMNILSFAVSGSNLFAGTFGGAFRSTNNGQSWTPINSGLTGLGLFVYSLVVNDANLYAGTVAGVFLSTDNGESWRPLNSGLANTNVFALAARGTTLFAGTSGGVYLSTGQGQSWRPVNSGLIATNITSFAVSEDNIFASTDGGGVFHSTNYGQSWTPVSSGLRGYGWYVFSLAVSGTDLYAGTFGGVFRSTDNGQNWTPVNSGLTDLDVYALAVSGANLFAGTIGGGVFLSTNNGQSWMPVNSGLPNLNIGSLAVSGTNLFAVTFGGLFLSTNNGQSWMPAGSGLPGYVSTLAVNGTNLFAATFDGVFLSTNNGQSWMPVNSGLTNSTVFSLAVSGANLFAGTNGGVFLSTNNGQNWRAVDPGLANTRVLSLAVTGLALFVGTHGGGVIVTQL